MAATRRGSVTHGEFGSTRVGHEGRGELHDRRKARIPHALFPVARVLRWIRNLLTRRS